MEVSHTGLFVPVDKTTLLLGTASPSLQSMCNVRAVIGPTHQRDRCCEILLLPILSSHNNCRENYDKAKTILQNYLSLLVKENVPNNDTKVGSSYKNYTNKAVNVADHKLISDEIGSKLQHGGINQDKRKVFFSEDRSVEILRDTTLITVKNESMLSPSKYPSIQSPTISNTDDIEIVNVINEHPNKSRSKEVLKDSRLTNSLHPVLGNKEKCDNNCRKVTGINYREPAKESDEDDEIVCVMNLPDVIDIDTLKEKGSVSGNSDARPIDTAPDIDKEDIVVLSGDDSSQKSDLSGRSKNLKKRSNRWRNLRKKRKSLTFGTKLCLVDSSAINNSEGNNVETDSSNESSDSTVVESNDDVDKLMTNIENTLKTLSNMENATSSNIVNKDVTIEDDDLSVIEIDIPGNDDEIILISENEDNDVENNNSICCIPITDGNQKKTQRRKKKRKDQFTGLNKDELIKRGFIIDPPNNFAKKNSAKHTRSLLGREQENRVCGIEVTSLKPSGSDNSSSEVLSNCKRANFISNASSVIKSNVPWSRPAHLNFLPVTNTSARCLPVTSKPSCVSAVTHTGPPLVVQNISTDATLNRKRKASSPVPHKDCSNSKRPKNRDKIGSNVCIPDDDVNVDSTKKTGLRPVIIDASNVAFSHGRNKDFSAKGIEICIRYFKSRGHRVIAILPNYRKAFIDDKLLHQWEKDGTLAFTPSRKVNGQMVVSHDDRYIIQVAAALEGVIVSQDHYRDFIGKNALWDEAIQKRLLMFMWVGDLLMFPEDPLGRHGPNLNDFLRFPSSSKPDGGSSSSRS